MVLSQLADAVEDENDTGSPTGLPDAPYRAAADAINNLATALPQPSPGPVAGLRDTSDEGAAARREPPALLAGASADRGGRAE